MNAQKIGQRISQRRKELDLTLQDVADRVHVARSTIQRYETGKINQMKMPVLFSIAQALQVNPHWLIEEDDSFPYISFFIQTPDGNTLSDNLDEVQEALSKSLTSLLTSHVDGSKPFHITPAEYALVLAYRLATPEDRQIIDNIASRYSTRKDQKEKIG